MATKNTDTVITIPAPNIKQMGVKIKGTSPLIYHKWSEKAKKMMRDKHAMKPKASKEARNPIEEYLSTFYYDTAGNIAFPSGSLKQSIVGAARSIDGVTMVELRGSVFVLGTAELEMITVLIDGKPFNPTEPNIDGEYPENIFGQDPKNPNVQMREDMVTVGMGSADLRYRGQVKNWEMEFIVKFNANKFSPEQILNLVQYAGFSQGIGEWRPEKNGAFGTFEVSHSTE